MVYLNNSAEAAVLTRLEGEKFSVTNRSCNFRQSHLREQKNNVGISKTIPAKSGVETLNSLYDGSRREYGFHMAGIEPKRSVTGRGDGANCSVSQNIRDTTVSDKEVEIETIDALIN